MAKVNAKKLSSILAYESDRDYSHFQALTSGIVSEGKSQMTELFGGHFAYDGSICNLISSNKRKLKFSIARGRDYTELTIKGRFQSSRGFGLDALKHMDGKITSIEWASRDKGRVSISKIEDLKFKGYIKDRMSNLPKKIFKGDDVLIGSRESDVLKGYKGNDVLIGGHGYDELWGGKGRDTFVIQKNLDSYTEIMDFDKRDDILDLPLPIGAYKFKRAGRNTLEVLERGDFICELNGVNSANDITII